MGIVHKYHKYRESDLVLEECGPETPQKSKPWLGWKSCTWAASVLWHIIVVMAAFLTSHSAFCWSRHSLENESWAILLVTCKMPSVISFFVWSFLIACGILQVAERMLPRAKLRGERHEEKHIPKCWSASVIWGRSLGIWNPGPQSWLFSFSNFPGLYSGICNQCPGWLWNRRS